MSIKTINEKEKLALWIRARNFISEIGVVFDWIEGTLFVLVGGLFFITFAALTYPFGLIYCFIREIFHKES